MLWSVDTRDWAGRDDASLRQYAIDTPEAGSIMLMHDIQPSTARVIGEVVAGLRDRGFGFSFVTIDDLFGGSVPSGGCSALLSDRGRGCWVGAARGR